MSVTTFDTLTYAKKLKQAGFTEAQAEAQAEALRAVVEQNLATKQDLKELENALRRELAEVKADMLKWITGLLVAQASLIIAAIKLL